MRRTPPADPAAEFRQLFDVLLGFAARHPVAGPKVAALGISGRGVFPDLKLVLNAAPAAPKLRARGTHVEWSWGAAPRGFTAQVLVACVDLRRMKPAALPDSLHALLESPA